MKTYRYEENRVDMGKAVREKALVLKDKMNNVDLSKYPPCYTGRGHHSLTH